MNKNLMLIHLESLNSMLYRLNEQFFPNIRRLEQEALTFPKYFSTATSTLMVIGDLVYGGMLQYESCSSMDCIPSAYPYDTSLFDELKKSNYNTGIYVYPGGADRESAEKRHIVGFSQVMELKEDYQEYLNSIEETMTENQPFAIMACNYCSNLALNSMIDSKANYSGSENWRIGYQKLDQSVGDILELLARKGKLDNTVIVLYGDHGDDYWQHGMHGGLTHAIEPYANLIHTPLFIWDKELGNGRNENLVSAIDVKEIISGLLSKKKECIWKSREYIVSRNSYAAQPIREENFNKSYSITDGKYLLLVSHKGMEMYDIEMDPMCGNNFLRFFALEDKLVIDEIVRDCNRFHFSYFMNLKEYRVIKQKFYFLKEKLYQETYGIYEAIGKTENQLKSEMKFDKIHNE